MSTEWVSPVWGIAVGGVTFRVLASPPNLDRFLPIQINSDFTLYCQRIAEAAVAFTANYGATNLYHTVAGADPALVISGVAYIRETSGKSVPASAVNSLLAWAAGERDKRLTTQLKKQPTKSCLKKKHEDEPPVPKVIAKKKKSEKTKKTARTPRELKALLLDHPQVPQVGLRRWKRTQRYVP
jgi:hypothetical protein